MLYDTASVDLVPTIAGSAGIAEVSSSVPAARTLPGAVLPRASNPVHPSFIVQVDGLLHAVFRLRLERDVCGTSVSSYCPKFGAGLSAASTFCGLFLPWPSPLSAIITAVKAERGYGVFAGPTPSVHAVGGHILLEFSFPSYSGDAWRAVLVSFAFRGKVRRKRPETFFSLSLICRLRPSVFFLSVGRASPAVS